MTTRSVEYPHGSARYFAQGAGPRWHTRESVERAVCESADVERYDPLLYQRVFGGRITPSERYVAIHGIEGNARVSTALDDLVGAAPERVLSWMLYKSRLADGGGGSAIGTVIISPETLQAVVAVHREADPGRRLLLNARRGFWETVEAGLLRCACGMRFNGIGVATGVSTPSARERVLHHDLALELDPDYRMAAAAILVAALARDF